MHGFRVRSSLSRVSDREAERAVRCALGCSEGIIAEQGGTDAVVTEPGS